MPDLKKAELREIGSEAKPTLGPAIPVQFNPATLKLTLANKIEGGDTRAQQKRQYLGKTSTTLAFDLHFDTTDQGTASDPVSVRTKTRDVEKFLLPKGEGKKKQKPPKVRFTWGDLQIDGIIEDLTIDFDLFAANGMPLRAKMAVVIREQDAKYQLGKEGPGANTGEAARPLGGGGGPGSSGSQRTDSTRGALAGESAAGFAARVGVDPAAWRGLADNMTSTLSLDGAAEVDFDSSLSLNAGIGVRVGVEAGASASLEASFGLDPAATPAVAAGVALSGKESSAGFALAAAGGVGAALEQVSTVRSASAADSARRAFAGSPMPGPATAVPVPAPPEQSRPPLVRRGLPSPRESAGARPAPGIPVADRRAASYGFGVPLRPQAVVDSARDSRGGVIEGRVPLRPRRRSDDLLEPEDPSAAPWTRLPVDPARARADREQKERRPLRPCGCAGACGHRP
jgi:hypothetical protein